MASVLAYSQTRRRSPIWGRQASAHDGTKDQPAMVFLSIECHTTFIVQHASILREEQITLCDSRPSQVQFHRRFSLIECENSTHDKLRGFQSSDSLNNHHATIDEDYTSTATNISKRNPSDPNSNSAARLYPIQEERLLEELWP
ncbi:unnamed protein product [Diplocarpon coronariae]